MSDNGDSGDSSYEPSSSDDEDDLTSSYSSADEDADEDEDDEDFDTIAEDEGYDQHPEQSTFLTDIHTRTEERLEIVAYLDAKITPKIFSRTQPFTKFSALPPELRNMIWEEAVHEQDRVISAPGGDIVMCASCPVLFLVCKESKQVAAKYYVRLEGGDLLAMSLRPLSMPCRGPVLSFDYDVFFVSNAWTYCSFERLASGEIIRNEEKSLPVPIACDKIEGLYRMGIRRVEQDKV
ncbi:hypothetical protein F5X99DRAFT_406738 [Biscogniauxia marginata]|nr:hypothetical protein F5X99DRAFT_406738 [Biscogniauxia marginata]